MYIFANRSKLCQCVVEYKNINNQQYNFLYITSSTQSLTKTNTYDRNVHIHKPEWKLRPPDQFGQNPATRSERNGWRWCSWKWHCFQKPPRLCTPPAISPLNDTNKAQVFNLRYYCCPFETLHLHIS